MRLHNRQVKASFWSDTDLIRELPRDGRWFYQGLWQLADDSGCVEDDVLAFKIHLFPADMDITPEVLEQYKQALVRLEKLIPYESKGKKCLFLTNFHKHQTIKNPGAPEVPLPPWVTWEPYESNPRSGKYTVSRLSVNCKNDVSTPSEGVVLQLSSNQNLNQNQKENQNPSTPPPPSPTNGEDAGEGHDPVKPRPVAPASLDDVLLKHPRYTEEQRAVIRDYWDVLRFTRKTARVSPNIIDQEMGYWGRFPPDIVIDALNIHIRKCQDKQEDYTRGIMRRLMRERGLDRGEYPDSGGPNTRTGPSAARRPTASDYTSGRYGRFFDTGEDAKTGTGS